MDADIKIAPLRNGCYKNYTVYTVIYGFQDFKSFNIKLLFTTYCFTFFFDSYLAYYTYRVNWKTGTYKNMFLRKEEKKLKKFAVVIYLAILHEDVFWR